MDPDENFPTYNRGSELENFRQQWKQELKSTSKKGKKRRAGAPNANAIASGPSTSQHDPAPVPVTPSAAPTEAELERVNIEEEAQRLFLEGVQLEKSRQYFDAIRCYKKALNLVPDIEYRFTKLQQEQSQAAGDPAQMTTNSVIDQPTAHDDMPEPLEDDNDYDSLEQKFLAEIEENGWKWFAQHRKDGLAHMENMPEEVIKYIVRWVVSNELDIRSLETLASVSKGFYVLARDEQLWKDICARTWQHLKARPPEFSTYREMFLKRPRVRLDGCYICKITYIRAGENSFQDESYKPWHLVEYYRYMKFEAGGKFYFLTSADLPATVMPHMRDPLTQTKYQNMLQGSYYYSLDGRHVYGQCWNPQQQHLSKKRHGKTYTYHLVLKIFSAKKKFNTGLAWVEYYSIGCLKGATSRNDIQVDHVSFPNFSFSRVKSFNKEAQSVLPSDSCLY